MKAVLINPHTCYRTLVELPDCGGALQHWLFEHSYEDTNIQGMDISHEPEPWEWRVAVSTEAVGCPETRFVYIQDVSRNGIRLACFGSTLIWPRIQSYTRLDNRLTGEDQLLSRVAGFAWPVELPEGTCISDLFPTLKRLYCYQCHLPVSQFADDGTPWCDNGHSAVPPGISMEKHINRDYLNQSLFDVQIFPTNFRKAMEREYCVTKENKYSYYTQPTYHRHLKRSEHKND